MGFEALRSLIPSLNEADSIYHSERSFLPSSSDSSPLQPSNFVIGPHVVGQCSKGIVLEKGLDDL